METNSILSAKILDILFEGRNKEYGAYQLRKSYNRRITLALGIMAGVVLISAAIVATGNVEKQSIKTPVIDILITEAYREVKKIIPPEPKTEKANKIKTTDNTKPIIVTDHKVKETLPENVELLKSGIGTQTIESPVDHTIASHQEIKGSQVLEVPKKNIDDDEVTFTSVQVEASFKGNWNAYLKEEIEKNIDELIEAGESGTCMVKFVVAKDGSVSNVEAITMKGTTLAEVSINAIKRGPKWIPALQNGIPVKAYRLQPVTFSINY